MKDGGTGTRLVEVGLQGHALDDEVVGEVGKELRLQEGPHLRGLGVEVDNGQVVEDEGDLVLHVARGDGRTAQALLASLVPDQRVQGQGRHEAGVERLRCEGNRARRRR